MAIPITHSIPVNSPLSTIEDGAAGLARRMKPDSAQDGGSFAETLKAYLNDVGELEKAAELQIQGLANGEITDVHQVMLAVEEANIALDLLIQIRNRLLEAYKELTTNSM
jgi:flagellar hook-basal body complex protein FliE